MKIILGIITGLVVVAAGALFFLAHQSRQQDIPPDIGASPLAGCPASPNCVSSTAGGDHAYRPWTLTADANWPQVVAEVAAMDGARIVADDGSGYLHVEYRSDLMGFIDDLELRLDGRTLSVRSASRVGHSDLGVNRGRVDRLGERLAAAGLVQGAAGA